MTQHTTGTEATVRVEKVYTHNGERLEIQCGEYNARLDALELESISWQDDETLAALVADTAHPPESLSGVAAAFGTEPVRIRNEYGEAEVRLVDGGDGLAVAAPKLGYEIELTPAELYMFSQQDRDTFSEFLGQPFGPDAEDHDVDWH
jgi:hypothetical protein